MLFNGGVQFLCVEIEFCFTFFTSLYFLIKFYLGLTVLGLRGCCGFCLVAGLGFPLSCRPLLWAWAQWLQLAALVAPRHVQSSWTRDHTCVSGIGRRLSHEGSRSA